MPNRCGVLSTLLPLALSLPLGAQEQGQGAPGPVGVLREVPPGVVASLGDEKFKTRRTAQGQLLEWGKKDLEGSVASLYQFYRKAENPEVRLRSREVLKALVILQQPLPGQGYLGIQMDTARWKNEQGIMQPAVLITDVREGTAAAIAKLREGDLIVGVDAVVFNDLAPTRLFADYIKSKKPGDEIRLKVRRGMEAVELTASLRRRPAALDEINQWGLFPVLPDESEMDENYFQEWLREQRLREGKEKKG